MADQPKVDNLLHISWCDSMWVPHLNAGNVLDYFSERSNPFYSRDCNNEYVKMQQNTRVDALTQMQGTEYMLLHAQDPILYIVRKQQRFSPSHVTPLSSYHIIAGQVFQTPDIGTVLNSRLASAMTHINSSFNELSSYSQYHPSKSYWWHFHNKTQQQLEQQQAHKETKEKKLSVKEEAATLFQRRRVEALLQDITTRFPYKQPPPPPAIEGQDSSAAPAAVNAAGGAGAATAAPVTAGGAASSTTQGPVSGTNISAAAVAIPPPSITSNTAASVPFSPAFNIKTEDIKQEERPDLRPDIKMEMKQEIKTEIKSEPQPMQQHFQRRMSSDSDVCDDGNEEVSFAIKLRKYPILHCKSTLPADIERKRAAWKALGECLNLPAEKIRKKIQNMTSKTRQVYSKSITGNKPIKAKPWQKEIKHQLDTNESNPVFHGVPGGVSSTGSRKQIPTPEQQSTSRPPTPQESSTSRSSGSSIPSSKRKYQYVTEEEENMSISQLQKIYLLDSIEESRARLEVYRRVNASRNTADQHIHYT